MNLPVCVAHQLSCPQWRRELQSTQRTTGKDAVGTVIAVILSAVLLLLPLSIWAQTNKRPGQCSTKFYRLQCATSVMSNQSCSPPHVGGEFNCPTTMTTGAFRGGPAYFTSEPDFRHQQGFTEVISVLDPGITVKLVDFQNRVKASINVDRGSYLGHTTWKPRVHSCKIILDSGLQEPEAEQCVGPDKVPEFPEEPLKPNDCPENNLNWLNPPESILNPIQLSDGSWSKSFGCLRVGGAGLSVGVDIGFDSNAVARGLQIDPSLPLGWSTSYTRRITTETMNGVTSKVLLTERGNVYRFDRNSVGAYINRENFNYATLTDTSGGGLALRYRSGLTELYDHNGILTAVVDRLGNRITVTMTAGIRTIRNERTGQAILQKYGTVAGKTRLLSIEDSPSNGGTPRVSRFTYDDTGETLLSYTDVSGRVHGFSYDQWNEPQQLTRYYNPQNSNSGTWTNVGYDENGRVVAQVSPLGETSHLNWLPLSRNDFHLEVVTRSGAADARTDRYLFQTKTVNGRLVSTGRILRAYVTNSTSQYTEYQYDARGNITNVYDPARRRIELVYDANGFVTEERSYISLTVFDRSLRANNAFGQPTLVTDPGGTQTSLHYHATTGVLERIVRSGNARNAANANSQISQTTMIEYDNGGAGIVLSGSATPAFPGLPTRVTLADGTVFKHDYDHRGYPSITTLDHGTGRLNIGAALTYDWRGYLTEELDARGVRTVYEYTNNPTGGQYGNLGLATAMIRDIAGRAVREEYTRDAMLNLTRTVMDAGSNRLNAETTATWEMVGFEGGYAPTSIRVKESATTWRERRFAYNTFGELTTLSEMAALDNGGNRVTTFVSDARGWLQSVRTADNQTAATYTYNNDLSGTIESIVDARGSRTSYLWDGKARLKTVRDGQQAITETNSAGQSVVRSAINAVTEYEYDSEDRITRAYTVLANGSTRDSTRRVFDGLDRLITVHDANGGKAEFYYDALRNWMSEMRESEVNAASAGRVTQYAYDRLGRLTSNRVDPAGLNLTHLYSYDVGSGDRVSLQRVTNPRGHSTLYQFNSLGLLAAATDSNGRVFSYSHNNLGHLLTLTPPAPSAPTSYVVNLLGEATSLTRTSGATSMIERWQYKSDGELRQFTDVSGQVIRYAYDAVGRLSSVDYQRASNDANDPNGARSDAEFSYYPNGLLRSATSKPDGVNPEVTHYDYDSANQLIQRLRGGRAVGYRYERDGSIVGIDYWGRGSVDLVRSSDTKLRSLSLWGGGTSNYQYQASNNRLSRITRTSTAEGITSNLSYDSAARLIKIAASGNSGNFLTLANTRFVNGVELGNLDANGNPLGLTETIRGEPGQKNTVYQYDTLDRVTRIDYPAISNAVPGYSESYQYDDSGNRTAITKDYPTRIPLSHADFNRDGKADLPWTETSTGMTGTWLMSGANSELFTGAIPMISGTATASYVEQGWVVQLSADFNRDGYNDFVARNYNSPEQVAIWIMGGADGMRRLAVIALPGGGAITGWVPEASGDFDRNGVPDIVWRNYQNGQNGIWYMGGKDGAEVLSTKLIDSVGTSWYLVGVADFNRDGIPDLVWHNVGSGGDLTFGMWPMSDPSAVLRDGSAALPAQGVQTIGDWVVESIADSDGDGTPDITWRHPATGGMGIWLMDPATPSNGFLRRPNVASVSTNGPTGYDWRVITTGQDAASRLAQVKAYDAFDRVTNAAELSDSNHALRQSSDGQTYAFDAAQRLMRSQRSDGSFVEYQYDALGNLVRSRRGVSGTVTSSDYVIDESRELPVLLGEIVGASETLYAYGVEGLHAQRSCLNGSCGAVQYALLDRLGSVRMLTDGQNVTSTVHFDAWGAIRSQNGTAKSALAFTGEQHFADGTVYLRARHYLPSQGRFLQRDSVDAGFLGQGLQGHNRFAYANNNPVQHTDPSGHAVWVVAAAAAILAYTELANPESVAPALPPTAPVEEQLDASKRQAAANCAHDNAEKDVWAIVDLAMQYAEGKAGSTPSNSPLTRAPRVSPNKPAPGASGRGAGDPDAQPRKLTVVQPYGPAPPPPRKFESRPNKNGGTVHGSKGPISWKDNLALIEEIGPGKRIDVFSGRHGRDDGSTMDVPRKDGKFPSAPPKLKTDGDVFVWEDAQLKRKLNGEGYDIKVHDIGTDAGRARLPAALEGPGHTICAWCYSQETLKKGPLLD